MSDKSDGGEDPTLVVTDVGVAIVRGVVRYPLNGGNMRRVVLTHALLMTQGYDCAALYLTGLLDGLSHQAQSRVEEMGRDEEMRRGQGHRLA